MWRTTVRAVAQDDVIKFQSTSSVWRTTFGVSSASCVAPYFNPRPPCGGRQHRLSYSPRPMQFQSTSSVWRTTRRRVRRLPRIVISIHVLRVEDDGFHFGDVEWPSIFQSTSSVWRTTQQIQKEKNFRQQYFNPRPPCGGRRQMPTMTGTMYSISIHVLRVEDDIAAIHSLSSIDNFNPRPPCGGRQRGHGSGWDAQIFQSTSSVWRTTSGWACPLGNPPPFQSTSSVWRTTTSV